MSSISEASSQNSSKQVSTTLNRVIEFSKAMTGAFAVWVMINEARQARGSSIDLNDPKYNLTIRAKEGRLKTVAGRDKEIDEIISILLLSDKPNALLIGDPGVGKTAIVEGLAQRIASGNVPERLKNCNVFILSSNDFIAGTAYRGQFETKVTKTIETVKKMGNAIIFVDETHGMMNVGGGVEGGGNNLANMLKPHLADGSFRMIGCTTPDEVEAIYNDSAMKRRFTEVKISKPTPRDIEKIVESRIPLYETKHGCIYDEEAINVILSNQRMLPGTAPDNVLHQLDLLGSKAEKKRPPSNLSKIKICGLSRNQWTFINGAIQIGLYALPTLYAFNRIQKIQISEDTYSYTSFKRFYGGLALLASAGCAYMFAVTLPIYDRFIKKYEQEEALRQVHVTKDDAINHLEQLRVAARTETHLSMYA